MPKKDITLAEFKKLVKDTRDLQKKYFQTRDRKVLIASKESEKALDKMVEAVLDIPLFIGEIES